MGFPDSAGGMTEHSALPQIQLAELCKQYGEVLVLQDLSLTVHQGDFIAVSGASGSGKTTLLGIIGLLETMTSGAYQLQGQDVNELGDAARSRLRNQTFGFIFQQFSLLPNLNAWQNVARPLTYARVPKRERRERAMTILEQLGLAERATHRPFQLSGGQQQRVAIARALINDPAIILADEPTGNLPKAQWEPVFDTLDLLNEAGKTIVVVSHNPEVVRRASRQFHLSGGQLTLISDPNVQGIDLAKSTNLAYQEVGAALVLNFLGNAEVQYRGSTLPVTSRQAEILALLASHPEGVSGEELLLLAYGEAGKMSTLKATLSRLRQHIPINSQPYRLADRYWADFVQTETLLKEGRLGEALDLYVGPLLPAATMPGVIAVREQLDEMLKQSVLASGNADATYTLAERLKEDLELWERAADLLAPGDPRRPLAVATVENIKRAW